MSFRAVLRNTGKSAFLMRHLRGLLHKFPRSRCRRFQILTLARKIWVPRSSRSASARTPLHLIWRTSLLPSILTTVASAYRLTTLTHSHRWLRASGRETSHSPCRAPGTRTPWTQVCGVAFSLCERWAALVLGGDFGTLSSLPPRAVHCGLTCRRVKAHWARAAIPRTFL